MSLKPVDIDDACAVLRSDGSTPEMRLKARKSLDTPHRLPVGRFSLVGVTVGLSAFLLWPRVTAGTTFAQAIDSSSKAIAVHLVTTGANGHLISEEWSSGKKSARIGYRENGDIFMEWRQDGKRVFCYNGFQISKGKENNPNSRKYGEVKTGGFGYTFSLGNNGSRLEHLLKLRNTKVLSEKTVTIDGTEATRYELQSQHFLNEHYFATISKKTGLVIETESTVGKWKAKYDYPSSIDNELFIPKAQTVKNIETYDLDKINQTIKSNLKNGLGTSKGIKLHSVTLDASNGLWVLWTGMELDSKLARTFKVDEIELGKPYTQAKFTNRPRKDIYNAPEYTPDGKRIYGLGRVALSKVGTHINLSIPTSKGIAVFKNVPVLRVGELYKLRPWSPKPSPPELIKKWAVPNNDRH